MACPEPALAEASIAASIAEIERLIAVKCFSEPNGAQRNPRLIPGWTPSVLPVTRYHAAY